jgi:WD40 repeat protein
MPLLLTCPECGGKLKLADHLAGKKIKCPKCSATFPAPAPAEPAVTAEAPPTQPEAVTPTVAPRAATADEGPARPRRLERNIRKDPAAEAVSTIIPYKNARALSAYYCGVFSLIPCLGLALGPIALVLGILGLRYVKAHPTAKGTGHAIAGVIMGGLTSLGNWGAAIAVLVMVIIGAMTATNPSQPIPRPPGTTNPMQQVPALFAGDRDLVNPNLRLNLPPEPGRQGAVRVEQQIHALAFSPDGKTLAVAGPTGVKLWGVATGQSRTIPGPAFSLAYSPDGAHLAVGRVGQKCVVELWDPATAVQERTLFEGVPVDRPEMMAFSSDGAVFAATANVTVNLWDVATWQKRPNGLKPQRWRISSLAFSPNGKTLAVGARDAVLLWDVTAMKEKGSLTGQPGDGAAVAFSSDGTTVASGGVGGGIRLWDAEQQQRLRSIKGHQQQVRAMAFSPDGKTLASSGQDGFLILWDVATGRELANRGSNPPGDMVNAVAFSPDGKMLVTGSAKGGILKAWDVAELDGQKK